MFEYNVPQFCGKCDGWALGNKHREREKGYLRSNLLIGGRLNTHAPATVHGRIDE